MEGMANEVAEREAPAEGGAPAEGEAAAEPKIALSVTPDDVPAGAPETFTVKVLQRAGGGSLKEAEILETFAGLLPETLYRLNSSEHIKFTEGETGEVARKELHKNILALVQNAKMIRALALRQAAIGKDFGALVEAAKYDSSKPTVDPAEPDAEAELKRKALDRDVALDKLRVFERTGNKQLGMRLAMMNREQRAKFYDSLKDRKRNVDRAKQMKAKKEKARADRRAAKARRKARRG